jgi:hypothetical protein
LSSMQFGNDDDSDPMTCRGRAAHARLAAKETNDHDFTRIFERLAELYDATADKLEAAGRHQSFRKIARCRQCPDLFTRLRFFRPGRCGRADALSSGWKPAGRFRVGSNSQWRKGRRHQVGAEDIRTAEVRLERDAAGASAKTGFLQEARFTFARPRCGSSIAGKSSRSVLRSCCRLL